LFKDKTENVFLMEAYCYGDCVYYTNYLLLKYYLHFSFRNEYYLTDLNVAPSQNVLRKSRPVTGEQIVIDEDEKDAKKVTSPAVSRKRTRQTSESVVDNETDSVKKPRTRRSSGQTLGGGATSVTGKSPVASRTRRASHSSETDGPPASGVSRVRTRSQCSSGDVSEVSREATAGVTTRTRAGAAGRLAGTSVVQRVRTRSMCSQGGDMEVDEASGTAVETTGQEGKGEDDIEAESDMSDDETDDAGKHRLSAIEETAETSDKEQKGDKSSKKDKVKRKSSDSKKGLGKDVRTVSHDDDTVAGGDGRQDKQRRKAAAGSLVVKLQLLAQFKDPYSVYREPELAKLYHDVSGGAIIPGASFNLICHIYKI